MADRTPQNFSNHTRFDPPFHFFILPVFAISLIATIVHLVRRPCFRSALLVVLMVAAITAIFKIRLYALKVQDRVIRLEERLRLATLLDPALRSRIAEFSESQLVALRFASDAELSALAARALNEKLSNSEIKKSIQHWRPDYWRV
jgi:asparagine N-glycosylation enzyme membrane subunit Stt3